MNLGLARNKSRLDLHMRKNVFSLGSQVGGPEAAEVTDRPEQQLRDALNDWSGYYTDAVKEFAFLLRVDGEIDTYTKMWRVFGAQEAKKKTNWVEVEIGIPQDWWKEGYLPFKQHLAEEIERGLSEMVKVLERHGGSVNKSALLSDWQKLKKKYLQRSN